MCMELLMAPPNGNPMIANLARNIFVGLDPFLFVHTPPPRNKHANYAFKYPCTYDIQPAMDKCQHIMG